MAILATVITVAAIAKKGHAAYKNSKNTKKAVNKSDTNAGYQKLKSDVISVMTQMVKKKQALSGPVIYKRVKDLGYTHTGNITKAMSEVGPSIIKLRKKLAVKRKKVIKTAISKTDVAKPKSKLPIPLLAGIGALAFFLIRKK